MGANKRGQQFSNRANGGSGSKALLEGVGPQRGTFTADGQSRPAAGSVPDGRQGTDAGEEAYPGVQASHLGVYRHDTSVSLMKYNVNG